MERFDVIIIGNGPAGLSAAITLKIRNKNILVLGNGEVSIKVSKAHEINNYLGIKAVSGKDLAEKFLSHAKKMGVQILDERISAVYKMGDYYSLQGKSGKMYESKAVIIATGVDFGKPYAGEEEFLGRGVSYCATCDAPLYKGKKVVIIGATKKEEGEAVFMSEVAKEVIYIPLYEGEVSFDDVNGDNLNDIKDDNLDDIKGDNLENKIKVVRDKVVAIEGKFKADTLVLENEKINADGFFILRDSINAKNLVPGLVMDGNHIKVNRLMETNLEGLFACGDIVGVPYQYIKAAGEGNISAISAAKYLDELNKMN